MARTLPKPLPTPPERPVLPRGLPMLKNVIVQCAVEGLISKRDAEDLIAMYGLREV